MPDIVPPKVIKKNDPPSGGKHNVQTDVSSDPANLAVPFDDNAKSDPDVNNSPQVNDGNSTSRQSTFNRPVAGSRPRGSSRPRQNPRSGNPNPIDPGFQGGSSAWGADPWADPWADPFAGGNTGGWGGGSGYGSDEPIKQMTPAERVSMIEKVYQDVLGRKPDTRDVNYYKYSTLLEDEITTQLLVGKEHAQLLEDGRDYKKMKDRAEQAESRVKMLEGQIKDQIEEFRGLTDLLEEKNRLIQQLRREQNNPYNFQKRNNINTPEFVQVHYPKSETSFRTERTSNGGAEIQDYDAQALDRTSDESTQRGVISKDDPETHFSAPVFNGSISDRTPNKRKQTFIDKIRDLFSVQ